MGVRDLLGGLVGKTAPTAGGMGLIPVQGTKILHATCCGQKKKWGSEELSLRIDGSSGESLPNEDTSGGCIGPAPVG